MKRGIALVGGVGLGATLMYFFDPDRGRRRRALIRDKAQATINQLGSTTGKVNRDLRNRLSGLIAETKGLFAQEQVPDEVLVDRVRAKLGRFCRDVAGLNVNARSGEVTLQGRVSADELKGVLRAARFVRGVKVINNQLDVNIPAGHGNPA